MIDVHDTEPAGLGLREYVAVLWRRKWLVLFVVAIAVGVSAAVTLSQPSVYKAETTIVVGQAGGLVQPQNANAIQPFSATMKELLTSTVVASRVIQNLGLNQRPQGLLGQISVSINPQSAALDVSVLDHSAVRARRIAHNLGIVFSRLVSQRFGRASETAPGIPAQPLTATIWDPAHVVPGRVSPKPVRNILIGGILGVILGVLAAFLREHFDRSLRTRDQIEEAFGAPVIGQIPAPKGWRQERPKFWFEDTLFGEAFRNLRANLQYLAIQRPLRTILVTSPAPHQGKTTVTANLAAPIAQSGASTVAVEADLRRPQLEAAFGLPRAGDGLTSVLIGNTKLAAALTDVVLAPVAKPDSTDHAVTVLPSGRLPPNPSELVSSGQMRELLQQLTDLYEYVLVDSPPMLLVADSLELARLVDGIIVVVRARSVTIDEVHELRAMVGRLGIPLVGVVLTDTPAPGGHYRAYAAASELDGEPEATSTKPARRRRWRRPPPSPAAKVAERRRRRRERTRSSE
jgi:capsular exopolysaccharide synthesis family protein